MLEIRLGWGRLALRCVEADGDSVDDLLTVGLCEGLALTFTLGVSLGKLVVSKVEVVALELDSVVGSGKHAEKRSGEERNLHFECFVKKIRSF